MEHRYYERNPVDFEVLVGWSDARLFRARAKNLSATGMMIDMPPDSIPFNKKLELYFRLLGRVYMVNALAVHANKEGIGLLFQTDQPDFYQCLRQIA